ncbi:hypothetical protein DN069_30630 [Streptacidiphilus pinicola]|uniref:DUF6542 domain-containing protein n=1 Tax=Streptacidiphilus pinicola TaxID=2219663 RepID=A0A2X0K2M6_9ACTN|nr:hypothetical protein DN069_30630 [Streptacidiphilus pinicola]
MLDPEESAGRGARRRGVPTQRSGGQPGGWEDGPAPEGRRHPAVVALVLILPPLAAALVSGGTGLVFWAGSLIGAIGAAALCSRPGVWWVSTGTPPVVLLMALAGLVVGDSSAKSAKLGTDLLKVVAGAFPVMGAALLCALVIGVARTLSARSARNVKGNGRG